MTNSKIKRTWRGVQTHIHKTVNNISRENNKVDWSKEEVLIAKLERKLGKPREEVTKMISQNLLSLLAMVPFGMDEK